MPPCVHAVNVAKLTSTNSAVSRRRSPSSTFDTRWPDKLVSTDPACTDQPSRAFASASTMIASASRSDCGSPLIAEMIREPEMLPVDTGSPPEREELVGRRIENLRDAHQGRQIGFATTAHIIAVAAFAQPGTSRDLCIREAELLGARSEIRGEWPHRERFVPDIPHGSRSALA